MLPGANDSKSSAAPGRAGAIDSYSYLSLSIALYSYLPSIASGAVNHQSPKVFFTMQKKTYQHPVASSMSLRTEGVIAVSLGDGSADPDKPVMAPPFEDDDELDEGPINYWS